MAFATPGLPLAAQVLFAAPLAALAIGFFYFHFRRPRDIHWLFLASCLAVTGASLRLLLEVLGGKVWDETIFRWLIIGGSSIEFGIRIDGLNAPILAMVATVSTLIHFYAVGYMRDDPGFSRFFLCFHFFFFSMVGLLVSHNYLQMYLFWEGVGLASFLLIGFWYDRPAARAAAWKAFLVNRIGDIGFLVAILVMMGWGGSVRFTELFAGLGLLDPGIVFLIAALLFWGACAKSAQFPLHVWLPDAMEGPTPVSALMHAATMVTAGVFLMARSWPILQYAPGLLSVLAVVGAFTAIGGAVLAGVQKDLKRILAYSTISHLGLMFLSLGVGSLFGAVFHLITHGFFKALLFLCAGSVIHGLGAHGTVTTDETGGLSISLPWTYAAFLVGALSLGGFPPLAGFFSKDAILHSLLVGGHAAGGPLGLLGSGLKAAGCLAAIASSYYIFRMLFLTFLGDRPQQTGRSAHAHEPGLWMQVPVFLLAALSAVGGVIGSAGLLEKVLSPLASAWGPMILVASSEVSAPFSWEVAGVGLAAAAAGLVAAWLATMAQSDWDWTWRMKHPGLERRVAGELGWQRLAARSAGLVSRAAAFVSWKWEDERWDVWTESLADCFTGLGEGLSGISRGILNEYLWWMLAGSVALTFMIVLCF
ncbi:MAG: NADH-quinone oxidoreductase subunit L [Elusimicrobia bacterium]|nr:NADH-quinone oxidoreductase subunit L [Elusimicrobiota bacterium]